MGDEKPKVAEAARVRTPADRPPKPERGTPWAHQPGCTNPNSADWDCACGPEVIAER